MAAAAAALCLAWLGPARAATPWQVAGPVAVRLLAAPAEGATRRVGVAFRLDPGWMTYWRSPGEAGIAPRFDWDGSANLGAATVAWPAPERFREGGFATFGYREQVVLPVAIVAAAPGAPVALRLTLDFAVCGTICVPKHAVLTLPADAPGSAAEAAEIAAFAARVPKPAQPGLTLRRIDLGPRALHVVLAAERPIAADAPLDLIAEGPDGVLGARPAIKRGLQGREAVLTLRPAGAAPLPERLDLTLRVGDRALSAVAKRGGAR